MADLIWDWNYACDERGACGLARPTSVPGNKPRDFIKNFT
jgi:hypothetical protein